MSIPVNKGKEKKRKKRTAAAAAILCVLAMPLTGTWAYYNSAEALNRFRGESETDAVLHDDYDRDGESDENGDIYHEKKVYVENTGASSLVVRITLEEYMEYLGKSYPEGAVRKNADADNGNGGDGGGEGNEGGSDNTETAAWHAHTYTQDNAGNYVCEDCGVEVYHQHYQWILSGSEYEPQDSGLVSRFYPADVAYQYRPATAAEKAAGLAQRYEYDQGTDSWSDTWAGVNLSSTAEAAEVIAMAEYWSRVEKYKADENDADGIDSDQWKGWIMDTDGYVYWSQRLAPGETTGLLLSGVVMTDTPYGDSYYYAIDVIMEAVDDVDIDSWLDGTISSTGIVPRKEATEEAAKLLKNLRKLETLTPGELLVIGNSEWIILDNNITAGTAVILSKDLVTTRQYHTATTEWQWSTSAVYEYLNGEYYENVLDPEVKELAVEVENRTNLPGAALTTQGDISEEYVFLLSEAEYNLYSTVGTGTIDFSQAGPYPVSQWWWLRTPNESVTRSGYGVLEDGTIATGTSSNSTYLVTTQAGIRPALVIKYK